jgi:hypothetical protein
MLTSFGKFDHGWQKGISESWIMGEIKKVELSENQTIVESRTVGKIGVSFFPNFHFPPFSSIFQYSIAWTHLMPNFHQGNRSI